LDGQQHTKKGIPILQIAPSAKTLQKKKQAGTNGTAEE